MTKQEFLARLREGLSLLPQSEREERLNFYGEMIDDRMEEGLSETDAVAAVGQIDEIIAQIRAEAPFQTPAPEPATPKREWKTWEIVLLLAGSPIWISLIIAAVAVVFAFYVVLWSAVVALWAVFGSLIACACGLATSGTVCFAFGNPLAGTALVGAGMVCAGLSILLCFGCEAATKGVAFLTKISVKGMVRCLSGKGKAK